MAPPTPERAGSVRQAACLLSSVRRLGQPVLGILGLHDADRAQPAGFHHLARLPDQRIAGIVVGEQELGAVLRLHLGQRLRILERRGERLVADHVDAGLEEGLGRADMHVVGRDDRHHLDAVLARRLGAGHLLVAGIDAVVGQPEIAPGFARHLGARGQRAGDEVVVAVEPRRDAVHIADEGPRAAADHAQPERARSVLCHFFVSPFSRCRASCGWPPCRCRRRRSRRTPFPSRG
jgi:hypothetical protein